MYEIWGKLDMLATTRSQHRHLLIVLWIVPLEVLLLSRYLNSLRPSDAYMRRWTGSSLVQIMACRLFGAKPLSEPMLEYC